MFPRVGPVIPVMQTRLTKAGAANCLQACLASILELPLDAVPDFVNGYDGDGHEWLDRCYAWLRERGWECQAFKPTLQDAAAVPDDMHFPWDRVTWWPEGYSIAQGVSRPGMPCAISAAERTVEHVCVALDGKVVHDPFPGGTGLAEVCCYWRFARLGVR